MAQGNFFPRGTIFPRSVPAKGRISPAIARTTPWQARDSAILLMARLLL